MALTAQHGQWETEAPLETAPSSTNQYSPSHKGLGLPPSEAIPQGSFQFVNSLMVLGRMKILI